MRAILIFPLLFFSAEATLELVHIFFRHGDRTPELVKGYPADPYTAETFFPTGYGRLTEKGKKTSYKLGQILRERYDSYLGKLYLPEIVEGTSTDFDRTKTSLLLVLAALFPPSGSQVWNENLNWIPIPINYEKDAIDYTLRRPTRYCPKYVEEFNKVMSSEKVQNEIKADEELYKYIEKHSKRPTREPLTVFEIYQTLNSEQGFNLTLPDWTKQVFPEKMRAVATRLVDYENYNDILKRLNGGRMLGKVMKHMLQKSDSSLSPPERKIYLYSGHENNVINILAALDVFVPHVPQYSASVIIELHRSADKKYGVKVFYLRGVQDEPEVQRLKGCEELCPLEKFARIIEAHIPVNYTLECNSKIALD